MAHPQLFETSFCSPGASFTFFPSSTAQFLHLFHSLSFPSPLTLKCFFFSRISPPTCSAELCPVPCGSHGVCSEGQCQCEEGWIGAACDQRACHPRCEEHGQCHDGTCVCQPGWEGEHCNIGERCPSPRGSVRLSCDILMSMINAFTKKKRCCCCSLDVFHLQSFWFLVFVPAVTHDLDVVVKGNLFLLR